MQFGTSSGASFGVQNGYVEPFIRPKWVEKSPVDGIPRGFVLLQVFGFSGGPRWAQSVGPEHPWTLDTSQIRWLQKFGALWEAKMVAMWGFWDVKWGPFGVQNGHVGPCGGPN